MRKQQATDAILQQKMLPLFYHDDVGTSISILRALYEAGIRTVEYTNRGAHALSNFREMKKLAASEMPGMLLGIGTIKTKQQAEEFIAAGADFIICPTMNLDVAAVTQAAGLLWIPGCLTPTEIALAEASGASIVKIFPGNILGPGYISSIKELFPGIMFMPTGGVEAEENNLRAWFSAGVVAVGMGSKLLTQQLIQDKDFEALRKKTSEAISLITTVNQ